MRMEFLDGQQATRTLGGAVVRADSADIIVEFGSADGPPMIRLRLSNGEALQLGVALKSVTDHRNEEIIFAEE
jgi:hypothetical protein